MNDYRILHMHWGGEDYYTPQRRVVTRKAWWFFKEKYEWWPIRGPLGFNGSLETAKEIIEADIKSIEDKKNNFTTHIEYP